ncbi:MAG: hypothetical protein CSA38_04045 [Flavobacteriales bacterium]|nr:MAG: hypothetical protein CSA38_04045 [Flavobacteriales bacterium]
MKQIIFLIIFFLINSSVLAQNKLEKDIDFDGIIDTIYIDNEKSVIVCILSSKNFKKTESKPIEILNLTSAITDAKNGFYFENDFMRAGYKNQFRYNSKSKKIQLIGMSRYEFGNASNDGSGESSVNLLTQNYIGNWNYFNHLANDGEGELVKIPTIRTKMKFKIINLENFSDETYFNYAEKCSELYHKHKNMKMNKK